MADIVPGIGLPQIDPYAVLQGLNFVVIAVVFILMFVVVFVFLWKKKLLWKFPTLFEIMKVENGMLTTVDFDQGRRVIKKHRDGSIKELYYDIKKRNFKWFPPSFESSVATKRGKSKFYVRELYPNKWEIIDPKAFVTGKETDYKRVEGDELDSYFKNTSDDVADLKYKLEESGWDKLMKLLGPVLPIAVAGIIFIIISTQVLLPAMDKANAITGAMQSANANVNASTQLLDKSTQYVELLINLLISNGIKVPVGYNITNVTP